MPQKTKKQKLKSHHNRQKKEIHVTVDTPLAEERIQQVHAHTFSFQRQQPNTGKISTTAAHDDAFVYLRGDLIRTIALAILCCGVLVALSFLLK